MHDRDASIFHEFSIPFQKYRIIVVVIQSTDVLGSATVVFIVLL